MRDTAVLPGDLPAECEDVIRRFEEAWHGQGPPDIGSYLPTPRPGNTRLLVELVHVDLTSGCATASPPGSSTTWSGSPSWGRTATRCWS